MGLSDFRDYQAERDGQPERVYIKTIQGTRNIRLSTSFNYRSTFRRSRLHVNCYDTGLDLLAYFEALTTSIKLRSSGL
jgi:hypothetical protein